MATNTARTSNNQPPSQNEELATLREACGSELIREIREMGAFGPMARKKACEFLHAHFFQNHPGTYQHLPALPDEVLYHLVTAK